jgi:4-carboxymuconolactone decarboxylase
MNRRYNKRRGWLVPILAMLALFAIAPASGAAPLDNRRHGWSQNQTGAAPLSPLAQARRDCPLLAAIIEEFAAIDLGEAFRQEAASVPSRDLTIATRFAILGDVPAMTSHARLARDAGATPDELRELLYLTVVSVGLPKAIEATRALAEAFGEESRCQERYAAANPQTEPR